MQISKLIDVCIQPLCQKCPQTKNSILKPIRTKPQHIINEALTHQTKTHKRYSRLQACRFQQKIVVLSENQDKLLA